MGGVTPADRVVLLAYILMSMPTRQELLWRFGKGRWSRDRGLAAAHPRSLAGGKLRRSSSSGWKVDGPRHVPPCTGCSRAGSHAEPGRRCAHRSVHRPRDVGALARASGHRGFAVTGRSIDTTCVSKLMTWPSWVSATGEALIHRMRRSLLFVQI